MLEESVVVHGDDAMLEAVGRQGGPAGVLGAELLGGEIQIEIDAADPNELCAVRVWHDGVVSPGASNVLGTLFGARAALIEEQLSNGRPVRIPGVESRRMTSFRGGVPYELQSFVGAADGLDRFGVPVEVRAALDLVRHVNALQSGLPTVLGEGADLFQVGLALAGATEVSFQMLSRVLSESVKLGVFTRAQVEDVLRGRRHARSEPNLALSFNAVRTSHSVLNVEEVLVAPSASARGEHVLVHEGSMHRDAVSWYWEDEDNLAVVVPSSGDSGPLWVRAWIDGRTPVAAVPMRNEGISMRALLLVPHSVGAITIDVAVSHSQRLLPGAAAELERAYASGRRAARTERCVGELEADPLWRVCAEAHEAAGDLQRSKMAMGRQNMRRAITIATVADHLLL